MEKCQTSNTRPTHPPTTLLLMFLHLPNKSPEIFPSKTSLLHKTPPGGPSSLGSCLISEHDAMARRPISIMLTWLIYVKDICFVNASAEKQRSQTMAVAGISHWQFYSFFIHIWFQSLLKIHHHSLFRNSSCLLLMSHAFVPICLHGVTDYR